MFDPCFHSLFRIFSQLTLKTIKLHAKKFIPHFPLTFSCRISHLGLYHQFGDTLYTGSFEKMGRTFLGRMVLIKVTKKYPLDVGLKISSVWECIKINAHVISNQIYIHRDNSHQADNVKHPTKPTWV